MKYRHAVVGAVLTCAALVPAVTPAPPSAASSTLSCSPTKVDQLTYRGGDVQRPMVTLIFWGSWWRSVSAAPVMTEMKHLFTGLADSSWAKIVTQYCDAYGDVPSTAGSTLLFATEIDSAKNPPTAPTAQQMTNEAAK